MVQSVGVGFWPSTSGGILCRKQGEDGHLQERKMCGCHNHGEVKRTKMNLNTKAAKDRT